MIAAADAEPPRPALHPHMATIFAQKVQTLRAALHQQEPALREAVREALRQFVERIEIPADPAALLTVRGVMGAMLSAATGRDGSGAAVEHFCADCQRGLRGRATR